MSTNDDEKPKKESPGDDDEKLGSKRRSDEEEKKAKERARPRRSHHRGSEATSPGAYSHQRHPDDKTLSREDRKAKEANRRARSRDSTGRGSFDSESRRRREDRKAQEAGKRSKSKESADRSADSQGHSRRRIHHQDKLAKEKSKRSNSSKSIAPGVEFARNNNDSDPRREALERQKDRKERMNRKNESSRSAAAAGGGILLNAIEVGDSGLEDGDAKPRDESQQNDNGQQQPQEQLTGNQEPGENQQGTTEDKDSEGDEVNDEKKNCRKTSLLYAIIAVLLGIVVYFLVRNNEDSNVNTGSTEGTANASDIPHHNDVTNSPTIDDDVVVFDPPSADVCLAISQGKSVVGQSEMIVESLIMTLDASLKFEVSIDLWLPGLKDNVQERLMDSMQESVMPILVGCPPYNERRSMLRSNTNFMLMQKDNFRTLEEFVSIVGNAKVDKSYNETGSCDREEEACHRIGLKIDLFLKENTENMFALVDHIVDPFRSRKSLANFLGVEDIVTKLAFVKLERAYVEPSQSPSFGPTDSPSFEPTTSPTLSFIPTFKGQTPAPTKGPSTSPSRETSSAPSLSPTRAPVLEQSAQPTISKSAMPSPIPTQVISANPSFAPVVGPTTEFPTILPTNKPSEIPSQAPSTPFPSFAPSKAQSQMPSHQPSVVLSSGPTQTASFLPSAGPTNTPSVLPSLSPTSIPSGSPTSKPSSIPTTCVTSWIQIGADITESSDRFGIQVALSDDGSTLAVVRFSFPPTATAVSVYKYMGSSWTRLGSDIPNLGGMLSFSSDGLRVAGIKSADCYDTSSHARVYEYSGSSWQQMGSAILGETGSYIHNVELSEDGKRFLVGYPLSVGWGQPRYDKNAYARVFEWDGSEWKQMGDDIISDEAGDHFGFSNSISSDGLRVAIGAPLNDGNGSNSGRVQVYEWDGTSWNQLGGDMYGVAANDEFGGFYGVSLSSDGKRLAASSICYWSKACIDHVRVFEYNGSSWNRIGQIIYGNAGDNFGLTVRMSSDGSRFIIGGRTNDDKFSNAGHAQVYEFDGATWNQVGLDMYGDGANDNLGMGAAMSSDGSIVAVGADGSSPRDYVRVYRDSCASGG